MQFIWSHCYNNEMYVLYSKAQDMYPGPIPCRYMVEFGTKLLEIHCTSAKEQQPQITNYVLSHQTETVLFLDNWGHAKQGFRKFTRKTRLKCQQN